MRTENTSNNNNSKSIIKEYPKEKGQQQIHRVLGRKLAAMCASGIYYK